MGRLEQDYERVDRGHRRQSEPRIRLDSQGRVQVRGELVIRDIRVRCG